MTKKSEKNLTLTNLNSATRGRQLKFKSVFNEFIVWYALPRPEKINLGIETQKDFADYHSISEQTLVAWTDRPEFLPAVKRLWKKWGQGRTPNIVQAIYNSSVGGGKEAPQAQKLWMQVIEDFTEKKDGTEISEKEAGGANIGDLKRLVDILPEELRQKHYGYIRELIGDIESFRNARESEVDDWDKRPPQTVPDETNNTPPALPSDERANEVAVGYKERIRKDLVTETNRPTRIPQNNYKGTERWREE